MNAAQQGVSAPPGDIWQCLEMFLGCHSAGIEMLLASRVLNRDAAEHLQCTGEPLTTKNFLA